MSKGERDDLGRLMRQRAKVARTSADQRAAELLAEFEQQMASVYSFDADEVWKAAHDAAQQVVQEAQARVAKRCAELGIPERFAPSLDVYWYGRGENASKKRRQELRLVAKSRIAALQKQAYAAIERASVEVQTELVAHGLTSDAAKAFLERMPTAEMLMPLLKLEQVEQLLLTRQQRG